jgi:hypothetical protein
LVFSQNLASFAKVGSKLAELAGRVKTIYAPKPLLADWCNKADGHPIL